MTLQALISKVFMRGRRRGEPVRVNLTLEAFLVDDEPDDRFHLVLHHELQGIVDDLVEIRRQRRTVGEVTLFGRFAPAQHPAAGWTGLERDIRPRRAEDAEIADTAERLINVAIASRCSSQQQFDRACLRFVAYRWGAWCDAEDCDAELDFVARCAAADGDAHLGAVES